MGIISSIRKSLIAYIHDYADKVALQLGVPVEYHQWEQRGEEDKLPKKTLIGLDNFQFDENEGLWVVRFAVSISSYQDFNLSREDIILDLAHEWFGWQRKVPMLDLTTGQEKAEMYIAAFEIAPMIQTQLRNYRVVSVEMLRATAEV